MSTIREFQGLWWYPDTPSEQWLGTLSLAPTKTPSLTITAPSTAKASRVEFPATLYGRANKPITLFHPFEEHSSCSSAISSHKFSAGYAIIGEEVASKESFKVNTLALRLHHFHEWVGRSGFQQSGVMDETARVAHRLPELLTFTVKESLSLSIVGSVSFSDEARERRIQEDTWLTFDDESGLDFARCFDLLHAARHLLHFAVLKPIYSVEMKCSREGYGSQVGGMFLPYDIEIWSSLNHSDVAPVVIPQLWVFRYSDIREDFGVFFGKWLRFCSTFEEALGCYFATIYHPLPHSVHFLSLTQAFEAYHGVKFTSHKEQIFEKKIQELAETHKISLQGLVDNPADFATAVLHNRNYYTHHNPKWKKDGRVVSGGELHRLNEKLRLLFQMCVLSDLGIPAARFDRLRRQLASYIINYE